MTTVNRIYMQEVICHDNTLDKNTIHFNLWSPNVYNACPMSDPNHTFVGPMIITSVSKREVMLTSDARETGGRYRNQDLVFDVPPGPSTGYPVASVKSFPYNVMFVSYEFAPKNENVGDSRSIYIAAASPVGTLTADVSSGNVIGVTNGLITKIGVGMEVTLDDGVNSQNLGECYEIDYVNQTLTMEKEVLFSFNLGTPIYVRHSIANNVDVLNTNIMKLGNRLPGNKFINSNLQVVLCYNNSTTDAKTVHLRTEMFV